jgi:hypothetical protein
LGDKKIAELH